MFISITLKELFNSFYSKSQVFSNIIWPPYIEFQLGFVYM